MFNVKVVTTRYLWGLLLLVLCLPVRAIPSELVVLYPDVRKPYEKIYQDIITGITAANPNGTETIVISEKQTAAAHASAIIAGKPDKIIALGASAVDIATRLTPGIPVIAGAISATDSKLTGISMIADPAVVIDKLRLLDSNIASIHVITDSTHKQVQLRAAVEYATSHNIQFIVHEAKTVKTAANEYKKALDQLGAHDAIWLMRDKALNDTSLLSAVLEVAWDKKIIVISSNPAHVKRGALFSIYPNNIALGARLAELANTTTSSQNSTNRLLLLRDIYIAGNGRTLRHLGLTEANETHQVLDNIL